MKKIHILVIALNILPILINIIMLLRGTHYTHIIVLIVLQVIFCYVVIICFQLADLCKQYRAQIELQQSLISQYEELLEEINPIHPEP